MKRERLATIFFLLFLVGCKNGPPPAAIAEELGTVAVTRWTDATELFMEYPPLVAGETARFAVHLTDLKSFKPLTEGRVTVELRSARERVEAFQTDAPSRASLEWT